jgi:ferredoxin
MSGLVQSLGSPSHQSVSSVIGFHRPGRLATDVNDPELVEALAGLEFSAQRGYEQPGGAGAGRGAAVLQSSRRLLQTAASTSIGVASTDLGCDGCSGYDNRIQVGSLDACMRACPVSCMRLF